MDHIGINIPQGRTKKMKLSDVIALVEKESLDGLSDNLLDWFRRHKIKPESITLADMSSQKSISSPFWLITSDIGENDASYRIVYSEKDKMFGLEVRNENNMSWFLGAFGTLKEAIEGM